ncbi:MAG TPA: hypothetical protein PLE61_01415 [Vicinamibacterales bacterium]|nr:hypothetical protein [Vicinamibacterales bacterium]HPW19446.1 hypothetical protein [Vicinamibacterales bacterium]
MKKVLVLAAWCVFLAALPVLAQEAAKPAVDVTGVWDSLVESPQGAMALVTTLRQEGDKVSGTQSTSMGELPLEGTVSGNDLTFTIKFDMQGQQAVVTFTAKVEGDSMTGTYDFAGMGGAGWTAKKKQ